MTTTPSTSARHAPSALRQRGSRCSPTAIRGVGPLRAQRGRRAHDDDLLARRAIAWHAASVLPAPGVATSRKSGRVVRRVAREELGLPAPRLDHAGRAPLTRGCSAGTAPARSPARSRRRRSPARRDRRATRDAAASPHSAQRPCAARNSATRAAGRKRRAPITAQVWQRAPPEVPPLCAESDFRVLGIEALNALPRDLGASAHAEADERGLVDQPPTPRRSQRSRPGSAHDLRLAEIREAGGECV